MKKSARICLALAIIASLLFAAWGMVRMFQATKFHYGCEAFIQRAANVSSVEEAKVNLDVAITYVEEHELSNSKKDSIQEWYLNLKQCYNALEEASDSNETETLLNVREKLLEFDNEHERSRVEKPWGISVTPYNGLYAIWGLISFMVAVCAWWLFKNREALQL